MIKSLIILFFSTLMVFTVNAKCHKQIKLKTIKNPVYQCEDGTISFQQGKKYSKDKKSDYEGMCGPTAAANAFHAYCKNYFVEPKSIAHKYFNDITPGVRPDTLKSGLNKMFYNNSECPYGTWKYYYSKNRWDFLSSLKSNLSNSKTYWTRTRSNGQKVKWAPVLVLLSKKSDGKVLHWVTVVDIIGYSYSDYNSYESSTCKVIYNDMGTQHTSSCESFVRYANQVDNNFFTKWLPEYIHLVFER